MNAMALEFEAFRTDSGYDLSMTDRRRSCSRLSSRRLRIALERGMRIQGIQVETEGIRVAEGDLWPEERLMKR
jgi:hypothetical protein